MSDCFNSNSLYNKGRIKKKKNKSYSCSKKIKWNNFRGSHTKPELPIWPVMFGINGHVSSGFHLVFAVIPRVAYGRTLKIFPMCP